MDDALPPTTPPRHGSRDFRDVLTARTSRRNIVLGATIAAAHLALAPGAAVARPAGRRLSASFRPVPVSAADRIVVPAGHRAEVLAPWGAPLLPDGPRWRPDGGGSAADQARQIGSHHSGLRYLPLAGGADGDRRGMLVIHHESVDPVLLHRREPGGGRAVTAARVAKGLAAQGVTAIEVRRGRDGTWHPVGSPRNARLTGTTPVVFSGPLATGHPALEGTAEPVGTLGNSGHGATPWGTHLVCEENTSGWFGTDDPGWRPTATQRRYGLGALDHGHGWHRADPRFDLARSPREPHRFGWIVEVDPLALNGPTPVKRTALGRFGHSAAAVGETRDGRVTVHSGDDQDGGYLYRFVGDRPWRRERAGGRSPLDHGVLQVARFDEDGTGRWLPLVHGRGTLTEAHGWADQADIVLRAREAADALGATRMDRPQQMAVDPRTGEVFAALANSAGGFGGAAGSRDANPYGHIIRLRDDPDGGTGLRWDVFVLGGDPAHDPSVRLDASNAFGSPKGLHLDPAGLLWIGTGVSPHSQHLAARGHENLGNNALLVADPATGVIRRFLTAPRGAEVTGVSGTPDGRALFVNIQHPGSATTAWGAPTPADPRAVSGWPDHRPDGRPRSATIAVRRDDGGVIGG
ncbi:PhoX family phosphatase [Streptomyces sp. NPDC006798]|uniref:PhoX family protein n=1 Tax=Streptomyces sp. NPDC006798 TaxID=3155462 RepID=UPI0033E06F97